MTEVTNGQIDPAHYGPTGDIARHIASYCNGSARVHVYTAAFQALATARAEAEALRSEVERLRALLDGVASFLDVAPLGSGVCCCGDPIEGHSYYSGHSPVDQASYTAGLWAKDIRTALGERL